MWNYLKAIGKRHTPRLYAAGMRIRDKLLYDVLGWPNNTIRYFAPLGVIYLAVPKSGCSTITAMFINKVYSPSEEKRYPHDDQYFTNLSRGEYRRHKDTYTFTFVRNPITRLASFYGNKIVDERVNDVYRRLYPGIFSPDMSFGDFVRAACAIPDHKTEGHLRSQYLIVYPGGIDQIDYIGKVERFNEDIAPLVERFGLDQVVAQNVKADRRASVEELYTKELATMVFERYRKDFECFDYQDDFRKFYNELAQ